MHIRLLQITLCLSPQGRRRARLESDMIRVKVVHSTRERYYKPAALSRILAGMNRVVIAEKLAEESKYYKSKLPVVVERVQQPFTRYGG